MLRYYLWAAAEKALSYVPFGAKIYYTAGRIAPRHAAGRIATPNSKGTGHDFITSVPMARKANELVPPGGTIIDLGTGWFHHDAFLLYLIGNYHVVLFDVMDKAEFTYIRNYLRNLLNQADYVSSELGLDAFEVKGKLHELLALPSRQSIYRRCNFSLHISDRVEEAFLPDGSVDFIVSNCVLVHVRPNVLEVELLALRKMLKREGYMYHLLGHDDHWAFHDPAMAWPSFNYMRYSEKVYRALFDTKFEYHNRMVKPEWIEFFERCGLKVAEYKTHITEESRRNLVALPKLDPRFAQYSLEELAVIHSLVLLKRDDAPPLRAEGLSGQGARSTR